MRLIKPGKLASGLGQTAKKVESNKASNSSRAIWDDFSVQKKVKKKEFEKGAGNRMYPKTEIPRGKEERDRDSESSRSVDQPRSESYYPRNDYSALEQRFSYTFKDRSLLEHALTHRSALGLKERADYERLEFLGDAVLDLSVAHLLSDRHPEAREGELSKMRAALVNTQALAGIAKDLDLGPYIKLGRGEVSSGGAERPSILADVMEAVVGAIYRDSNYDQSMLIIETIFGEMLDQVTPYDPKTELQEELHAAGSEPPTYLLELVEGPEHAPTFVTVVVVDGEIAGRGRGNTKKAAQQEAAAQALFKMLPGSPPIELKEGQRILIVEALLVVNTIQATKDDESIEGEPENVAEDELTEDDLAKDSI